MIGKKIVRIPESGNIDLQGLKNSPFVSEQEIETLKNLKLKAQNAIDQYQQTFDLLESKTKNFKNLHKEHIRETANLDRHLTRVTRSNEQLEKEIQNLNGEKSKIHQQIEELLERESALQSKNQSSAKLKLSLEEDIAQQKENLQIAKERFTQENQSSSDFEKSIAALTKELNLLDQNFLEISQQSETLVHNIEQQNALFDQLRTEKLELESKTSHLKNTLSDQEKELKKIASETLLEQEEIAELQKSKEIIQTRVEELTRAIEVETFGLSGLEQQKELVLTEITQLNQQVQTIKNRSQEISDSCLALEKEIKEHEVQKSRLEQQVQKLNAEFDQELSYQASVGEENAALLSQIEELENLKVSKKKDVNYQQMISESTDNLLLFNVHRLQDLKLTLSDQSFRLDIEKKQHQHLWSQIQSTQNEINSKLETITQWEFDIDFYCRENTKLLTKLSEHKELFQEVSQAFELIKCQEADVKEELFETEGLIKETQRKIKTHTEEITRLKQTAFETEEQLINLRQQEGLLTTSLKKVSEQNDHEETRLNKVTAQYQETLTRFQRMEQVLQATQTELSERKTEQERQIREFFLLQEKLQSSSKQLKQLTRQINESFTTARDARSIAPKTQEIFDLLHTVQAKAQDLNQINQKDVEEIFRPSTLKNTVDANLSQLFEIDSHLDQVSQALNQTREENIRLEQEIDLTQSQIHTADHDYHEQLKELEILERKNKMHVSRLQEQKMRLEQYRTQLRSKMLERDQKAPMLNYIRELMTRIKMIQKDIQDLEERGQESTAIRRSIPDDLSA